MVFSSVYDLTAFADAAVAPIDFPIAPAYAVPKVGTKLIMAEQETASLPNYGLCQ